MKGQIQTPCTMDWNSFSVNNEGQSRFCPSCQKSVFDITQMSEQQVEDLYFKNNQSLCVRAKAIKENYFHKTLRKIGVACFIVLSSFFTKKAIAQVVESPMIDTFKICQEESEKDFITIRGVVKGENLHRMKRLRGTEIRIETAEGLVVEKITTIIGGRFSVRLP